MTDQQFKEQLRDYLAQFSGGRKPIVPLVSNSDGTINRERTLAMPCYADFKWRRVEESNPDAFTSPSFQD